MEVDEKIEVGVFSPREALFLLILELKESGLSTDNRDIANRIRRHWRTVMRLREDPQHLADETTAKNLEDAIWDAIDFPWSKDVVAQIGIMRTFTRRRALREAFYGYRFSGVASLAVVRDIHRSGRTDLTTEEVDHLLVAYHWILPIINDTTKRDYRACRQEFPLVVDVLFRYLDSREQTPWSTVLRGKVSMNDIGSRWSAMTADMRMSEEVRREFEEREHIKVTLNYAKIMGEQSDALHNALAYASRFEDESLFPELGRRVMQAHDYDTVRAFEEAVQKEYNGRNAEDASDFSPFFQWANKRGFTGHDEVQEPAELGDVA